MTREDLKTWLDAYGRAWERRDAQAVVELFAEEATYQETPFVEPLRGRAAIREYWTDAVVQAQQQIRFGYQILAVTEDSGIAHWWASFVRVSTKAQVKLDGIFLLTFASGNLCRELREWWMKKN
jgi:ketosteroid isomerase-like protein